MTPSSPFAARIAALLVALAAVTAGAVGPPGTDAPRADGLELSDDARESSRSTGGPPAVRPAGVTEAYCGAARGTGSSATGRPGEVSVRRTEADDSKPADGPSRGLSRTAGGTEGRDDAAGAATSEGVAAIDADAAHAAGYTGEDVTVAVVDFGFDPDDPAIADRVVATKDFTGSGIERGTTRHGTGIAGIVADTAPDASLVLVAVESSDDLVAAIDWIDDATDADVVTTSVGLIGGAPLDGTAALDRRVDRSVANGTVWVVAAGNQATDHWAGSWRDDDGDDRLEFAPDEERLDVSGATRVTVQWDDWPESDRNYDAYLVDESGAVVARSRTVQDGSRPPLEELRYDGDGDGPVSLVVERVDADGDATFDVFVRGTSLERPVENRSLIVPATSRRAITVGAVDHRDATLEAFSSRGATADGRRKPDLVGPDRVSTTTFSSFEGTSAAAPHVAGGAALVLDADPTLSPREVTRRLVDNATPVTGTEPNNVTGWGLVDVDDSIRPASPVSTAIDPPTNGSTRDRVAVAVTFPAPPAGGTVAVRVRDRENRSVRASAPADTGTRTTVVTVDVSDLGNGPLTARAKAIDDLGTSSVGGFVAESDPVEKPTAGGDDQPGTDADCAVAGGE